MTERQVKLSSLLTSRQIICGIGGMAWAEVIRRLVDLIWEDETTRDAQDVYRVILESDTCATTFLEPATAVVHARMSGLTKLRIALASCPGGLVCPNCKALGCATAQAATVNLAVLILTPGDDPAGYLRTIAALGRILRGGLIERLMRAPDSTAAWKLLDDGGDHLPEYVSARDMMRRDFPRLRDTDPLSKAIDAFCRLGVDELPVLDADGDLIGVVTQDELLRVCLPEYVTWMDDLTPILNFEPFAEMLRREASAPVIQIMVFAERYATVEESSPAIQVAKVMMRRDVRQVLVMRGAKPVGVISIQDFIRKILRS